MSLSDDLIHHAVRLLLASDTPEGQGELDLRRAISACYYALFHQLNADSAALIAPDVSVETNHRIQRWFDHVTMKQTCQRFVPIKLSHPLKGLIGDSASDELRTVALAFIELQEARHDADYNLSYAVNHDLAREYIATATGALKAWANLAGTEEANIFILSLLLWKNWERDRP